MKNSNYQRLTVYLNNVESKKDFATTHTYNGIQTENEAINVVYTMHSDASDNAHDISRKIKRVIYHGKNINLFSKENSQTKNGWIVK
jgi:hypothetical protein